MATLCAIGNDPIEPNRLSLNNGLQHAEFYVGPPVQSVNASPVTNIAEYLAKRKDGSEDFVTLKVLTLSAAGDSAEDRHGKVLLHNEMQVLSFLHDQSGVVHHYGLFKDRNLLILVLDCLQAHDYDVRGRYRDYINLQHYVIQEKRLGERDALELFFQLLITVDALHRKNIVHRDIKLGNIVFNARSRELTITNFALSKHLVREDEPLSDQRGSLAYISPDVLSGSPYCGKASDMWSMGVLLFTMLFGQFPFYDNEPQELFKKIRAASYTIPNESHVTMETTLLIKQLIRLDVKTRLTAVGALEAIQNRLSRFRPLRTIETVPEASQIVPDVEGMGEEDCMVPDHSTDASSASARPIDGSVAANIHLTALRLSLSPQALNPDVYLPPGTFANLSNSPVASPNSLLLFPDTLAYPSGNPFLCTNGAHAQPFMSSTGLSTSPQSVPGFGSLHIHSASPSSSFPPSLLPPSHPGHAKPGDGLLPTLLLSPFLPPPTCVHDALLLLIQRGTPSFPGHSPREPLRGQQAQQCGLV
eukprot:Em0023g714a